MRGLIIYSSRTGGTKRMAEGIHQFLGDEWEVYPVKSAPDWREYDVIAIGFWAFRGGWDPSVEKYVKDITGKKIYIFGTLGTYCDGPYAFRMMRRRVLAMEKRGNHVLGNYFCTGALDPLRLKEKMEHPERFLHPVTEEKKIRGRVYSAHPTNREIELCGERIHYRVMVEKEKGEL